MYLPSLTDRATLALNCLTNHVDPSRGRLPWFYTRLSDRPLSATLAIWSYGDGLGRSLDAISLLRSMTNSPLTPADHEMMTTLLSFIHPDDGLSWCPASPWTLPQAHTRPAWLQQGTLLALTSWYLLTGDEKYRTAASRNIAGVAKISLPHPDGSATFPGDVYTKEAGWTPLSTDPMHPASVFYTSTTMPLLRFARVTGDDQAIHLATQLLNWAINDHAGGATLFDRGHFHCQSRVITSLLLRYVIVHDNHDLALAEHLYLKAKKLGTSTGWFPEQINNPENNRSNLSETCCLTDMIESALLLAQYKDPSYYDDVERFARNHLLVHQMIDSDWFSQSTYVPREKHVLGFNSEKGSAEGTIISDNLRQTILGGFAGWGAVTAFSDDSMFSNTNQHCCNAAGARALYDVWRYALTDDGSTLSYHLHFHRSHLAADLLVHETPETMTLTLTPRSARRYKIRIPSWTTPSSATITRNHQPCPAPAESGYWDLGPLHPGDTLTLSYPLTPKSSPESLPPGTFTFQYAGPTVLTASPPQKLRPLFTPNRFQSTPPALSPTLREINSL